MRAELKWRTPGEVNVCERSHLAELLATLLGSVKFVLRDKQIIVYFRPEDLIFNTHACGFLSRWLQPDSYADPQKTALILNKDDIRCGWPATVVVQTKDQYGDVVHVPNMKVRITWISLEYFPELSHLRVANFSL